ENISGTVSGLNGAANIQIRYGAGKTQFVSPNVKGFYHIDNLPQNVSYTLTPISPTTPPNIFRFDKSSLVIPAGNGDKSDANFAATQQVIMSGNVSVQGKAVKGVTVSLEEFSFIKTTTDSHGNYSVWVPMGVTITPKATHPYFSFADGPSAGHPADFTQSWSTAVVKVSGHVLLNGGGLKNVTLTVSPKGAVTLTATTDASGFYALTVTTDDTPNLYSFVVTPALTGYTFSPKSQTFSMSSGVTKNFTAIPNKWSVSGTVTSNSKGLSGVEIDFTINGGAVHKDFTNSKGVYTLTGVPFGASVLITPKKTGFSFTPTNITFTMGNANLPGQDFSTN
ncbi:MAG TPA: hypothetical protein VKF38_15600, partial [Anaerolineaceae bacterium]|nr:hypothetical protein [Anaerolineaceae bacterium]